MLRVCKLVNGRYAIENTMTGLLCNRNGHAYSYRSQKRAIKKMRKITKEINNLGMKYGRYGR